MPTNYPNSLDTFPSSTTLATHTLSTDPHSVLHGNLGDALSALEIKVGINSSTVTSSLDYKVSHLLTRQVIAGSGLSGGGDLSSDVTLSLPNVGTANTYGDSTHYPIITTDSQGRVSSVITQLVQGGVQTDIANTFTVGPQTIRTGGNSNKGLLVKGNSGSQSANLQEWQDSVGNVLTAVQSDGTFFIHNASHPTADLTLVAVSDASEPNFKFMVGSTTGFGLRSNAILQLGVGGLITNGGVISLDDTNGFSRGNFKLFFGDGGGQLLLQSGHTALQAGRVAHHFDTATTITLSDLLGVNNNGTRIFTVGSGGTGIAGKFNVQNSTDKGLIVQGAPSQSANLQEWQDSSTSALSAILPNGSWQPPSISDSSATNNSLYYSTTQSKLVFKDSGGTANPLY